MNQSHPSIAVIFANYGPYHHARVRDLQLSYHGEVIPVEISSSNNTYQWNECVSCCDGLEAFVDGECESASFLPTFFSALAFFRRRGVKIAFIAGYYPGSIIGTLIAAKVLGIKAVIMSDNHHSTERSTGFKKIIKKFIVSLYDGAFVAGAPHMDYIVDLGMNPSMVMLGYDVVDNRYFELRSEIVLSEPDAYRKKYSLPPVFLLSLGRFVPKKNLDYLLKAYARLVFKHNYRELGIKLVLVGDGAERDELKRLAVNLGLSVSDELSDGDGIDISADVQIHSFKQISDLPVYYALAHGFVLPSFAEEWGLVVNEAMASGTLVCVSKGCGCASSLVVDGESGFVFDPRSI